MHTFSKWEEERRWTLWEEQKQSSPSGGQGLGGSQQASARASSLVCVA